MLQRTDKMCLAVLVLNGESRRGAEPLTMRSPASDTDATTAPLRRQMEQSQRLGSTMPSRRSSPRYPAPLSHVARCLPWSVTPPPSVNIRRPLHGMAFFWLKPGGFVFTGSGPPVGPVLSRKSDVG